MDELIISTPRNRRIRRRGEDDTPTAVNSERWLRTVVDTADDLRTELRTALNQVTKIITTENIEDDARRGLVVLAAKRLRAITTTIGVGREILVDPDNIEEEEDEDINQAYDETQDPDYNPNGQQGRNLRPRNVNEGSLAATAGEVKQALWLTAMREKGVEQGTGSSPHDLVFIGAKHFDKVPTLYLPEWPATADSPEVQVLSRSLLNGFSNLVFSGQGAGTEQWQRLHVWSCKDLCNFFLNDSTGRPAADHLNSVISGATSGKADEITNENLRRAEIAKNNPDNLPLEQYLWDAFTVVLQNQLKSNNAYRKFLSGLGEVSWVARVKDVQEELERDPAGTLALKFMRTTSTGRGGQSLLLDYVADKSGLARTKTRSLFKTQKPVHQMVAHWGPGLLLLASHSRLNQVIQKNSYTAVPQIIQVVDRVFPQFQRIVRVVNTRVALPLICEPGDDYNALKSCRVRVKDDDMDFTERLLRALPVPTQDYTGVEWL